MYYNVYTMTSPCNSLNGTRKFLTFVWRFTHFFQLLEWRCFLLCITINEPLPIRYFSHFFLPFFSFWKVTTQLCTQLMKWFFHLKRFSFEAKFLYNQTLCVKRHIKKYSCHISTLSGGLRLPLIKFEIQLRLCRTQSSHSHQTVKNGSKHSPLMKWKNSSIWLIDFDWILHTWIYATKCSTFRFYKRQI